MNWRRHNDRCYSASVSQDVGIPPVWVVQDEKTKRWLVARDRRGFIRPGFLTLRDAQQSVDPDQRDLL